MTQPDLEAKLRETKIRGGFEIRSYQDRLGRYLWLNDEAIAHIVEAFEAAGYVKKEWRSSGTVNGERYEHLEVMTGQEWYERYIGEDEHTDPKHDPGYQYYKGRNDLRAEIRVGIERAAHIGDK